MDTQRDLDNASYTSNLVTEDEMARIFEVARNAFASDPSVHAALDASQIAFEAYRESQLKLISIINSGTVGPLIRNAEDQLLCGQRAKLLRVLIADNAPDQLL